MKRSVQHRGAESNTGGMAMDIRLREQEESGGHDVEIRGGEAALEIEEWSRATLLEATFCQ